MGVSKAIKPIMPYNTIAMKRIKILGAGLSGLTAAINLAKKGYGVDVYEKMKTWVCGFMVTSRVWKTGLKRKTFWKN